MGVGSNTLYAADNPNYYMDCEDRNMTPERYKYLSKCSDRELKIRNLIGSSKYYLKACKDDLNHFPGWGFLKAKVKQEKINLIALRNELNRLKGMDKVVVVGDDEPFVNTLTGAEYWTCKCGTGIYVTDNYCSNCGKRILWRR